MSSLKPDREHWFWCESEKRAVRAWIVCAHALAGEPIREPGPPCVSNEWTGTVCCLARRLDGHAISEAKLMCEYCAAKEVPRFEYWLKMHGWRGPGSPCTMTPGGIAP